MSMFENDIALDKQAIDGMKRRLESLLAEREAIDDKIRRTRWAILQLDKDASEGRPYEGMRAAVAAHLYIERYGPMLREILKDELLKRGACSNKRHPGRSIGQGIEAAINPPRKKGKPKPRPSLYLRKDGAIDVKPETVPKAEQKR